MSQEEIPYLQYATPVNDPMPTGVRVIAIIGICLGGLTLLQRVMGVFTAIILMNVSKMQMFGRPYSVYQLISGVVFLAFAAWLLAVSIGCLRQQSWARVWMIRYAVTYSVALVVDMVGQILIVAPGMSVFMSRMMTVPTTGPAVAPGTGPAALPFNMSSMMSTMLIVQAVFGVVVLLVYPAFIFVIMRRPAARAFLSS